MKAEKWVYTPHETGMVGWKAAKRAIENAQFGINFPHIDGCDIGEYFAPLMPWEVLAVIGQTHNGKTLLSDWWENAICAQLKAENRNEVIVHVSLEESLEAMSFYQHAKVLKVRPSEIAGGKIDLKRIEFSMTVIDEIPIYRIADSSETDDSEDMPELYLSNIYRLIRSLKEGKVTGNEVKPAVIVVDYLQALPYDPETRKDQEEGKRRIQVRKDVYRLRQMTVHLECPIIVNVQAKQKLEGANPPLMIPGMYDGEETSAVGQRFDRIMSIWMPKNNYPVGSCHAQIGTITEGQFYIKVNKQRGGFPSGKSFELKWDFDKHELLSAFGSTVAEKEQRADRVRDYVG